MSWKEEREEAMFWRLMREALYDDMDGRPVGQPRLANHQIEEIRSRFAGGEHQYALAREFRVRKQIVSQHCRGVVRVSGRGAHRVRKIPYAGMAA